MDYIKKLETRAMFYIYWAIFVFFMYCLYEIPIVSIVVAVFVGNEALAVFGAQKKKNIEIRKILRLGFEYGILTASRLNRFTHSITN